VGSARIRRPPRVFGANPTLLKMYYVYILQSKKDNKYYIGSTADLERRIREHQSGRVKSTKHKLSLELLCYEAYSDKLITQKREKYLKSSDGHKDINKRFN